MKKLILSVITLLSFASIVGMEQSKQWLEAHDMSSPEVAVNEETTDQELSSDKKTIIGLSKTQPTDAEIYRSPERSTNKSSNKLWKIIEKRKKNNKNSNEEVTREVCRRLLFEND